MYRNADGLRKLGWLKTGGTKAICNVLRLSRLYASVPAGASYDFDVRHVIVNAGGTSEFRVDSDGKFRHRGGDQVSCTAAGNAPSPLCVRAPTTSGGYSIWLGITTAFTFCRCINIVARFGHHMRWHPCTLHRSTRHRSARHRSTRPHPQHRHQRTLSFLRTKCSSIYRTNSSKHRFRSEFRH